MNSKDVKIIIAVIIAVIVAVILYSLYERNKDENMGNMGNDQGSTLVSPVHKLSSSAQPKMTMQKMDDFQQSIQKLF